MDNRKITTPKKTKKQNKKKKKEIVEWGNDDWISITPKYYALTFTITFVLNI